MSTIANRIANVRKMSRLDLFSATRDVDRVIKREGASEDHDRQEAPASAKPGVERPAYPVVGLFHDTLRSM